MVKETLGRLKYARFVFSSSIKSWTSAAFDFRQQALRSAVLGFFFPAFELVRLVLLVAGMMKQSNSLKGLSWKWSIHLHPSLSRIWYVCMVTVSMVYIGPTSNHSPSVGHLLSLGLSRGHEDSRTSYRSMVLHWLRIGHQPAIIQSVYVRLRRQ